MQQEDRVALAADIVSAHVANNKVAIADLPGLIRNVHTALSSLGREDRKPEPQKKKPAVSVRASVKPDYLVCLECGARQKALRRHLATAHGLSPAQYRTEYGLPSTYPMVAADYSEKRRALAKSLGLGRKTGRRKAGGAAKAERASAKPAGARRKGGGNDRGKGGEKGGA